jgi:hypothetical protein
VEKLQGTGAVQDAGANLCDFRGREASWSAAALRRFYGRTRPAKRDQIKRARRRLEQTTQQFFSRFGHLSFGNYICILTALSSSDTLFSKPTILECHHLHTCPDNPDTESKNFES